MRELMSKVRDFRRAMGLPIHDEAEDGASMDDARLAGELVREEAEETLEALARYMDGNRPDRWALDDLVDVADGLADLVYVAAGLALVLGIDLAAVFEPVHAANMRKGPGPFREDGKKLKPDGWVGPEAKIRAILARDFPALAIEATASTVEGTFREPFGRKWPSDGQAVELDGLIARSVLGEEFAAELPAGVSFLESVGPHDTIGDVFPGGLMVRTHDPDGGCFGCPFLDVDIMSRCDALGLREVPGEEPPDDCPLRSGGVMVTNGGQ